MKLLYEAIVVDGKPALEQGRFPYAPVAQGLKDASDEKRRDASKSSDYLAQYNTLSVPPGESSETPA